MRISLKSDNEIVSLGTFKRIGTDWILDRFCNKNYNSVSGSFSKILAFFIKKYKPNSIITYSDNMISNGDIYKISGFQCVSEINPTYSLLIDKKRVHRLTKKSDNYPKIWNSGLKKWILNPK